MTPKERTVMQQALEALGTLDCGDSYKTHNAATALREALADQAEQEPVLKRRIGDCLLCGHCADTGKRIYAAPVRTKDLTDDEIREIEMSVEPFAIEFARAVIAADREKNK